MLPDDIIEIILLKREVYIAFKSIDGTSECLGIYHKYKDAQTIIINELLQKDLTSFDYYNPANKLNWEESLGDTKYDYYIEVWVQNRADGLIATYHLLFDKWLKKHIEDENLDYNAITRLLGEWKSKTPDIIYNMFEII